MNLSSANRILIVGCSGGGKSTLTRELSRKLNLPPIHLDVHFWQPQWVEPSSDEWREKVYALAYEERWVMDGTFSESFDIRFPRADVIIVLRLPMMICLFRAILRVFKYSKVRRRSDMAVGCDETINISFYKYIWTFNSEVYPKILSALSQFGANEKAIFLRSSKDVRRFISELN